MKVKIKRESKEVHLPQQGNPGDAGYDVIITGFSKIYKNGGIRELHKLEASHYVLSSLQRVVCHTGLYAAPEEMKYISATIRSSLGMWDGLYIPNSPCTFDEGYRGEILIVVANGSQSPVTLKVGERFAQLLGKDRHELEFEEVDELPVSKRGKGMFGSTGK